MHIQLVRKFIQKLLMPRQQSEEVVAIKNQQDIV